MDEVKQIRTRDDLMALANELGMRPDWHEPDEREVTARAFGGNFDNAGFYGQAEFLDWIQRYGFERAERGIEMWITLYRDGDPVAEVNLASLFAFACGWDGA